MENGMEIDEKAYTSSEVAAMLDIGVTTVRKYAQHLEKAGHDFFKTKSNARLFVENDLMALRYLKGLREKSNITVEQAAAIVQEKFQKDKKQTTPLNNTSKANEENEQYNELKQLLYKQNQLLEGLIKRLDDQQDNINDRLNERDRMLMHSINERLEAQKLIAAAQEEQTVDKQSFFSKVFKKGS